MVNEEAVYRLKKVGKSVGRALGVGIKETGRTLVAGLRGVPPDEQAVRNKQVDYLPKNVRKYYK